MSDCERCGRNAKLQLVEIAGAQMYVCPDCSRFGKPIREKIEAPPPSPTISRARPSRPPKPDALTNRSRELVEDFSTKIQRARERKGWSREELGKKINERVSIISKLEHGEMHPPDSLIKKLERVLDIQLMEDIEDIHVTHGAESRGMTLGDFIVYKDK